MVEAGKYFQVTERTWHNWESGLHRIPFAVYKLLRVLARYELPDGAWAGWRFDAGQLITPEGRQIAPTDGAWWSLLVRQAAGFRGVFDELSRLRCLVGPAAQVREAQPPASAAGAGLVPSKTSPEGSLSISFAPSNSSQYDVIMQSWPIHSDSRMPLRPLRAPKLTTLESPLMPSSVSPWTPIYGVRLTCSQPEPGPYRLSQPHLKQVGNQPGPVSPSSSLALKSKPSMKPRNGNDKPSLVDSAMPAAAKAAKLASAARGAS